ncbi:hypothetical protein BCV69DRAFT_283836 [Microstroma glucosiphilum]|uniref:Uncharacterized protein n=1 Tax=Pseudomicrostroma glucosiphilum TaxID=1684307 RepID=A0A316U3H3_9BASI|nr:hypothetical protein BCV69DRAFT_283836 [Pseudomicrostroma glucosiphilum]PWN19730.1 hypothetical protein BCV69DRAFT_283836 [Pseudomicrostroma glucosiphilum]
MATDHVATQSQLPSTNNNTEGSKFKRFLKKFGRKPSDEAVATSPQQAHTGAVSSSTGKDGQQDIFAALSSPPASAPTGKSSGGGTTKLSKSRSKNAAPAAAVDGKSSRLNSGANASDMDRLKSSQTVDRSPSPLGFTGNGTQGLADTLVMPREASSQAPQLDGLPAHEPINPTDVAPAQVESTDPAFTDASADLGQHSTNGVVAAGAAGDSGAGLVETGQGATAGQSSVLAEDGAAMRSIPTSSSLAVEEQIGGANAGSNGNARLGNVGPPSAYSRNAHLSDHSSTSPSRSGPETSFEDVDSTEGFRRRDSSDTRTVDTGKSTKPTTLMSLETRENTGHSGLAQIAQYRHGDQSSPTSNNSAAARAAAGSPSIQFASSPTASRTTTSGAVPLVNLPGYNDPMEETPYTNVPAISRPHPSNNPTPSGIPPDNASVLTLASSTAAQSIGGPASVRQGGAGAAGHHYTPSLAGARSIGGSLMGDRRNSSDTYASMRALPPLSRRGSDASTRTGRDSVAPSATGLTSANAMTGMLSGGNASSSNIAMPASTSAYTSGAGAPADRMGIKRTDSQRTVATQHSIPYSLSTSNHAAFMNSGAERRPSTASANLLNYQQAPSAQGGHSVTSAPTLTAAPALSLAGTGGSDGHIPPPEEGSLPTPVVATAPMAAPSMASRLEGLLGKPELHHADSTGGQKLRMTEEGFADRVSPA